MNDIEVIDLSMEDDEIPAPPPNPPPTPQAMSDPHQSSLNMPLRIPGFYDAEQYIKTEGGVGEQPAYVGVPESFPRQPYLPPQNIFGPTIAPPQNGGMNQSFFTESQAAPTSIASHWGGLNAPFNMDGQGMPTTPQRNTAYTYTSGPAPVTPQSQPVLQPESSSKRRKLSATASSTQYTPPSTPGYFGQQARAQILSPNQTQPLPSTQELMHGYTEVKTLLEQFNTLIPTVKKLTRRIDKLQQHNRELEQQVGSLRKETKLAIKDTNEHVAELINAIDEERAASGQGDPVPGGAFGGPRDQNVPRSSGVMNGLVNPNGS